MLPVPTVCAISQGKASSKTAAAKREIRNTKRREDFQFKIVNLPFGLFTEPLLKLPFQKLGCWIGNRRSMGLETAHSTWRERHEFKSRYSRTQVDC
jgi:hypothetical protein